MELRSRPLSRAARARRGRNLKCTFTCWITFAHNLFTSCKQQRFVWTWTDKPYWQHEWCSRWDNERDGDRSSKAAWWTEKTPETVPADTQHLPMFYINFLKQHTQTLKHKLQEHAQILTVGSFAVWRLCLRCNSFSAASVGTLGVYKTKNGMEKLCNGRNFTEINYECCFAWKQKLQTWKSPCTVQFQTHCNGNSLFSKFLKLKTYVYQKETPN